MEITSDQKADLRLMPALDTPRYHVALVHHPRAMISVVELILSSSEFAQDYDQSQFYSPRTLHYRLQYPLALAPIDARLMSQPGSAFSLKIENEQNEALGTRHERSKTRKLL
jgi:hypothetical protein